MLFFICLVIVVDVFVFCGIYNYYVQIIVISFEIEVVSVEIMVVCIVDVQVDFFWLVFEEQGEVFGYVYVSKWKLCVVYWYLVESLVYLCYDVGGCGIGKQFYCEFIVQLKFLGVYLVIGGIVQFNLVSVVLYESVGFVVCGVFMEVGYKMGCWIDVGYW